MDVVLPGVEGFAVRGHEVFEVGVFGQLGHTRGNERPGFHFIVMAVPQLSFLVIQAFETLLTDGVLNANKFCIWCITIEDHALMQIMLQMNAKVRSFDLAAHIVSIEMETIEIRAHGFERILWLQQIRADIQHPVLERVALRYLGGVQNFPARENTRCSDCAGRNAHTNTFEIIESHIATLSTGCDRENSSCCRKRPGQMAVVCDWE